MEDNFGQKGELRIGKGGLRGRSSGDEIFRDNEKTEGGRIKAAGKVVKTRMGVDEGAQPNVNCRVQSFGLIVEKFNDRKLKWVKDMGFHGLMYLRGKTLPRGLCYWLLSKIDPINKLFLGSPDCEYALDKSQVYWVFGIPHGPKVVPRGSRRDKYAAYVEEFYEKFGVVSRGKRYICMNKVVEAVERDCDEDYEKDFKEAFLALALVFVLCPTTCAKLETDLIPSLSVAVIAKEYNWCGLVFEKLIFHTIRFAEKFYEQGFAMCSGGCTYFLAIFYLDRLERRPVEWDIFPRIRAWKDEEVNRAKNEDKVSDEAGSDYGRLKFLNVAYGERHPCAARDTTGPQQMCDGVYDFGDDLGLDDNVGVHKGRR